MIAAGFGPWLAEGAPKELPLLVTVGDLSDNPDRYDGHRVVVTGYVRSMEVQIGRRGSEYVLLTLEESRSSHSKSPLTVISITAPAVQKGHHALIQGIYRREGRQGGRPFHHFIDAEVILREK